MIALDPTDALALTLHHAPGVQAVLLGSGISSAAGIPTGWAITLDLIRRLASLSEIHDQSNWAAWYKKQYEKDPSYSEILDAIASTPAERRDILHGYIEAAEGKPPRQPTKAHRAIAKLVGLGSVRVILTTNFDRLLEKALRDQGIEPTVIDTDDAAVGATPLVHSRCTVIKLHGDYMDARIKNTADELERYSPAVDGLLDRVLDEYGLVVAGWSGEWDTALRAAILRSKSKRYPVYWASRGEISALGRDLLRHKDGREIPIADADSFFSAVVGKVEALQTLHRSHPITIALTVAEGKRLCREARLAPDWSDLLAHEVETFSNFITGDEYPREAPNKENFNALVNNIIARSEALRRLVLVGVRWGCDEAFQITLRAISGLTFLGFGSGEYVSWVSMRQLAASLCFHWAVAAALLRDDYVRSAQILYMSIRTMRDGNKPAVFKLPLTMFYESTSIDWKKLIGLESHYTPHSDFFSAFFTADVRDVVVSTNEADPIWDYAEFLIAMEYGYLRLMQMQEEKGCWFYAPLGRFVWKSESPRCDERLNQVCRLPQESPILKAGLWGGTPATAKQTAEGLREYIFIKYPHFVHLAMRERSG